MIPAIREWFNGNFAEEKYEKYKAFFSRYETDPITFRIAETPVFVQNDFKQKMLDTADFIVEAIMSKGFKAMTQGAIPDFIQYKNEGEHPHFIAFDFGICKNPENRELEPQLVEMQGFPSLYFYQFYQEKAAREAYGIPENYDIFLNGFNEEATIDLLKKVIVGNENPENVILLELYPEKQKTKIDFFFTEKHLGIQTICLTKIKFDGDQIYYEKEGKRIPVKRIYNRLIWDDVVRNDDIFIKEQADKVMGTNVEWVTHPSWFYRISKYTLPFLRHPNIPPTYFLNTFNEAAPKDLADYVLKPLFSYSGRGVMIHPTLYDFYNIEEQSQYILQKRVQYDAAIVTPDGPAKAEIRLFYIWDEEMARPIATHNLARLTKAEMIGVDFNADQKWIGGSFAYFEK
ncbi:MAG: hypothetical protein DI598_16640 [Pseudopedobacter saltans]|uniref:Circularly permuted ATPgrasp domain-containing protein n=1 Tax=Pseudopedobacter saltans TaxID=151895 RepID=A0A2W5EMF1_9SPHI|nr:MAG: hypothetical protein DI598_16640 [Pseudopedobacter saltans]